MAAEAGALEGELGIALRAAAERKAEASADAASGQAIDSEHPWLGLDSFTEETRAYFYGREQEVAELARRVQRKLLTILFGQSGLGKTSILRAGIVPKLRPSGYCPVYVRIDYGAESPPPAEQIKQAIFRATRAQGEWTQAGAAVEGESLWEFLHHRDDVLRDAQGAVVVPLLIFDQFEEIFTLAQGDDQGRRRAAQFLEELADLVENRPPRALEARIDGDDSLSERFDFARADYRILIALREDYLAHLEGVKSVMPSITQNRMRLARMTGEQALAAVTKPGGRLVSQEVAESIVRFVAGGSELPNAEVEPSLLSLICRELNNARIAQGRSEISVDLLAGSKETILAEFYERALADQPAAVRRFIEDEMLTDSGFRESLGEERVRKAFNAAGASPDALARLVDRRLLRVEERLDLRRVELTHDVLCKVVAESRDLRHAREAKEEAERQLAAQKAREQAAHKALVRARQVAAACAALAIGAVASAIWGLHSMNRAQEAEAKALQTRQMAEAARGQAEKLIVYLLDDFYTELAPVGRLDIVADLSRRALDYYTRLPPDLRTADTERNRALALVRHGNALGWLGRMDESLAALAEANALLEKAMAAGDRSELTVIGLAVGLASQARLMLVGRSDPRSLETAVRASEILTPMLVGTPSPALRRAQGEVMNRVGFVQMRVGSPQDAVESFQASRDAYRSIDQLSLADLGSAAGYVEASAWMMEALIVGLGRDDDAKRIGEESGKVAAQILERRPGHMGALRSHSLVYGFLAAVAFNQMHIRRALELNLQHDRSLLELLKLDPGNSIAGNNLIGGLQAQAYGLFVLGRVRESIDKLREALELASKFPELLQGRAFAAARLAIVEDDAGITHGRASRRFDYRKLYEGAASKSHPESFQRVWLLEVISTWDRERMLIAGEHAELVRSARESIKRREGLKPSAEGDRRQQTFGLGTAHWQLGEALYRMKDYGGAEAALRQGLEIVKSIPPSFLNQQIPRSRQRIVLALSVARQGRLDEARRLVEPELRWHRDLVARGSESLEQRFVMAQGLLAAAVASPERARSHLVEAAAIMDAMPREARSLKSTSEVRGWIAQEMAKRP